MITKFKRSSRITEINAVTTRMIDAFYNSGLESDIILTKTFTQLKTQNDLLTRAIKKAHINSVLEEKDNNRGIDFRALWFFLLGMIYNPDEIIAKAARSLYNIMERYGLSLTKESYDIESSLLESLIADFEQTEATAALAAIPGAQGLFDKLKTSSKNFEDARVEQDANKTEVKQQKNASQIKDEMVKYINEGLINYLSATITISPDIYTNFAETINTIVDNNNSNVGRR